MFIYLVRHGDYEKNKRAGWGNNCLTEKGLLQANSLSKEIENNATLNIKYIYSSDLVRAMQTAMPTACILGLPIMKLKCFRAPNNGILSNMLAIEADRLYPNLHYYTLDYEEKYPGGESPQEFYERICESWDEFIKTIFTDGDIVVFTHSSVIRVIYCKLSGKKYDNKDNSKIEEAKLLPIKITKNIIKCMFEI